MSNCVSLWCSNQPTIVLLLQMGSVSPVHWRDRSEYEKSDCGQVRQLQMFHRRWLLRLDHVRLLLRWHQKVLRSVRADGDQTDTSRTSCASSRMVELEKDHRYDQQHLSLSRHCSTVLLGRWSPEPDWCVGMSRVQPFRPGNLLNCIDSWRFCLKRFY